ncbi:sterol desaturase family protein [Sphingomonas rhizophila]|uniref:Sterol desaturase family protein n=1 Tax=Sphingomonas rhizophila TaxID=2071607 RepID=A0A7G9SC24_9SPHN|nr:sterol desaturase family protein [Sphingomonas rhizophila]QNN65399.1 sterol desaturase family protein [Sphingomonas rhizophila]
MATGLILSSVAMTLIVGVRYLITSGLFAAWTARRFPGRLAGMRPQVRREIAWSLASAAIYGAPAGIVAWGWQERGWTRIYADVADYPLWWMPVSLLAYLLAHDTWFYWTHRLMHRPWWFKRMHSVHHDSRPPTAWAAMSFHPWEAATGAIVIPLLVFVIPIHIAVLGLVLTIMTVMGVTNHMGWEMFPRIMVQGKLGKWLITASHHELHHQKYRCNYGLYFRLWDHLCGTDRGLGTFAAPRPRDDRHDRRQPAAGRQPAPVD